MDAGPNLDPPQLVSRGTLELRGVAVFEFGWTTVQGETVATTAGNEVVLSDLEAGTDFATGKHGKARGSVSIVAQSCCAIRGHNRAEERSIGPKKLHLSLKRLGRAPSQEMLAHLGSAQMQFG